MSKSATIASLADHTRRVRRELDRAFHVNDDVRRIASAAEAQLLFSLMRELHNSLQRAQAEEAA